MSRSGLTSRAKLHVTPSAEQASLHVAVRIRPILVKGSPSSDPSAQKDIIRVMDEQVVIVLDPDEQKDYLDKVQGRTKEKQYTFDRAFGTEAKNCDVYDGTIRELVHGCMNGLNVTVFAYGATGSGKTYTMVGTTHDPGLMVLSLQRIFCDRQDLYADEHFDVTCSYIEVYNEVIYDLLVRNSGPLELREDPSLGVQVAGIRKHTVASPEEIMALLEQGNTRRKTESTNANSTSSRSHAVLEINIIRKPKNQYKTNSLRGKLSLVDLAGSERAAETNNAGQKLRDGANINRSLLALANCINALGKQGRRGMAYVPYRNSKLTRLLKDGLSGNSKTAMIATVSCAADQYHHSINTLKYADRAKEIKTHVSKNVGSVESHVSDYQRIIDNLQNEVQQLKAQLSQQESPHANGLPTVPEEEGRAVEASQQQDEEAAQMKWLDDLSSEINENTEERINLQKALFELEDTNVCNKCELQHLENYLQSGQPSEMEAMEVQERISAMKANVADNEDTGLRYRADIEANEAQRRGIQERINAAMDKYSSTSFLQVLSTFRMQAVRLQELQFQMAVRDQVISEQRDVISNLWRVIEGVGLDKDQIQAVALEQGILMEGLSNPEMGPVGRATNDGIWHGFFPERAGKSQSAANDMALANKSMCGARAQYRYNFWQHYDGIPVGEDDSDCEREPNQGTRGPHRPSTSQSDHDLRYNSPVPRGRRQNSDGARCSDENLPAAKFRHKQSKVGSYGKQSPAKSVRARGGQQGEGPLPGNGDGSVGRQPQLQQQRSGRARFGRRGGGAPVDGAGRGPGFAAHKMGLAHQQDGGRQAMKVVSNAWAENETLLAPDLVIGCAAPGTRAQGQKEAAPPSGRIASQLGRIKNRMSGRAAAEHKALPAATATKASGLRIDGIEAPSQQAADHSLSEHRRARIERLRKRGKPRAPAATSWE